MSKKLLLAFFLLPILSNAQNILEIVKLKNNKLAILYDNGSWAYANIEEVKVTSASSYQNNGASSKTISAAKSNYTNTQSQSTSTSYTSTCGARTKKGGACQRRVHGGGRCWQH